MVKLFEIDLPDYTVDTEPNHAALGKAVDQLIKSNFDGKTIIARGLSSTAHPGKTAKDIIETIITTGTDRYDSNRTGDRYENIQGKHIDLFAFRRKVTPRMQLFKDISWGFYHGSKAIHGLPVRIDIISLYDASQLKAIVHRYEVRDDTKRDGYIFTNPEHKVSALIGVIHIK